MEVHRKTRSGTGGSEVLRRQAELLEIGRHPGVVELVGLEGSSDRPALVTVLVEGPTLAASTTLTVQEVAGLVGTLASTLADLHDLGIVHGAVTPDHVVLARDGYPVLCGFGSAGRVGEVAPGGGDDLHPGTDVAALGRLLRRLATGPEARSLRRIAEVATADDPATRPSAREMASELATAVPGARLPAPGERSSASPLGHDRVTDLRSLVAGARPDRPRLAITRRRPTTTPGVATTGRLAVSTGDDDQTRRPSAAGPAPGHRRSPVRPWALVGGIGAVAAVGLLALTPWSSPTKADARRAMPPVSAPAVAPVRPSTTTTALAPTSTTLAAMRSDCPAPTSVVVADVDGDGCLDAVRYANGVLEAAGTRWELGRAGDQVTTGDWSCGGKRTVALLRPSTGEVFRFDGWAVGGADSVTGSVVATVPGGQAVRAADVDRDGCHELVIERGELPPQVVRLPRKPA